MKRLTYLSVAEMELIETAQFYEERQAGLGGAFLEAARRGGERIQAHPEMYSVYEKPVRGYRLSPFPVRLLYRDLPDRIQVVAVAHLSRRPGYWKDRLR